MNTLTGRDFEAMVRNGYRDIKLQYQKINDLNVFPVPDGDTGTNITATMAGGIKSMEKSDLDDISDVSAKLASGMLLGARGNSGVIVSQFFQGLAEGLEGLKSATIPQFISALNAATSKAYQAVVHPVEGTILTVAREGTDYLSGHADEINDFEFLFTNLLREMSISLDHTPELLPVLKEAGVIDSGGAGLVAIIEGMGKEIKGERLEESEFHGPQNSIATDSEVPFDEDSELEYGYCTEFILQLLNCKNGPKEFSLKDLIHYLETIGDSIVALRQKNIVKIHVHTKEPWKAIQYAQKYGEFVTFKMENMSIQHNEVLLKEMPIEEKKRVKHAIIAVAPSKEIGKLFTDMGVNEIISGGQTMNPSAEDFVRAFEEANADEILVFPNNGNIILTAEQAAKLFEGSKITVCHTKSIIQAYSALSMLDLEGLSMEENVEVVNECIENLTVCEVSTAIRDSVNNGVTIKEGDFLGISDGEVKNADPKLMDCVQHLLESVEDIDDKSVITVFYGAEAKPEDKEALRALIKKNYRLMDLIEVDGHQSIYPFVFALE